MKKIYLLVAAIAFIAVNFSFADARSFGIIESLGHSLIMANEKSSNLAVDFGVSDTLTCSGVVQFTDLSGNGANAWIWHFGDGGTASVQNPTHTYTSAGYFTVSLTTVGVSGIDSLVKTNYIHVAFLASPTVSNDTTICAYNPVTVTASGSGQIAWFDTISGGTQLDTGASYTTGPLTATTTFYAASQQLQPSFYGGPADSSLGGGGYNSPGPMSRYTTLDCNVACRLVSVLVYAAGAGNRTVTFSNNAGNIIHSLAVNIPDGESRVYLNFDIPAGTGYRLGIAGNNVNLYRNNAGAVYPYDINGMVSLTGNNGGGPDFYYYFYDWEVSTPPCVSARIPVTVTVTPGPQASFTYSQNLSSFTCTDQTVGATSWSWDFGDGSAAVLTQNANHTYAAPGTYVITLTASNGGCSSSSSITVNATIFNFSVSDTLTCTGIVQFTDLANNGATAWIWHFGDGGSSTLQNPSHTYTSAGYFTVTFTTVGINGIDSLVKTNYIHVALLTAPTVSNDTTICQYNPVTLTASGSGQIAWFDSSVGGNQLDTGNAFTSGPLVASTTFYAASQQVGASFYGGAVDSSLGGGGFYTQNNDWALVFDCNTACRVVSVKVYAQGAGIRTIYLNDNNGNQLNTISVNVPDGESRVALNFDIQPGTNYELTCTGPPDLYRNNAGANYPYDINGMISITGNTAGAAGFYYFFYDWEISDPPCVSPRVPVNVTVTPGPQASFVFNQNLNVFTCTDLTVGATTWSWSFGDGSAAVTTQNAIHSYTTSGTYVITLTAGNGTCSSTQSVTVNATFTGINENYLSQVSLQPNPVKDVLNINVPVFKGDLKLSVMNSLGQTVYSTIITEVNRNTASIDLSSLAKGVYILNLEADDAMLLRKIIRE